LDGLINAPAGASRKEIEMMSYSELKVFARYVYSFYGAGGVYDMGVPIEIINQAIRFLQSKDGSKYRCGQPVIGDSLDREHIRMVLEERYGYSEIACSYPK
jgi:hypothetical protein